MDYEGMEYDPRDDEEIKGDEEFEVCARCMNGCSYCLMLED